MTSFIQNFLPSFAANLAAMMIQVSGSGISQRFAKPGLQQAVKRCVEHSITILISTSDDLSPETDHILTDCFQDYFSSRAVIRELSKILRGKEPELEELIWLFEEAGYNEENLPGLNFTKGIQAFIAAFMTSAALEPELNSIIQAEQLIKQTKLQQEILDKIRKLVDFLRKDGGNDVMGIKAGQIEARNVISNLRIIYKRPPDPPVKFYITKIHHYLSTLIKGCDVLQLAAIDESCSADEAIRMSDVFVSTNLTQHRFPDQTIAESLTGKKVKSSSQDLSFKPAWASKFEGLEKYDPNNLPIQAVEAVGNMSRLVIIGRPGSGKSTLVNYITTRLALRNLSDTKISTDLTGFSEDESPLPVRIILRHFAAWISSDTKKGSAGLVWDYINHMLEQWGCNCYENMRMILQNWGGVIFFDGLDEVNEKDENSKRSIITESIYKFSLPLNNCRVIITCREYVYKKTDAWRLPEKIFPVSELALFDIEQIWEFTHIWYRVIGPQKEWNEAKQKSETENLYSAIKKMPYLKEIARYPLLLTLIAQVHGNYGYLPNDRADLYEKVVNLLLEHWDNRLIRDTDGTCRRESGLILRLGIRRIALRSVLEKIAFEAHEQQEEEKDRSGQCADISKRDLLESFNKELGVLDKAEKVIEYIRERTGLLTALDNRTYTFPHRTFQEYLAAAYIMRQSEFDVILIERVKRDLNWWREVFLLAASYSKSVPRNVSNMIDIMLPYEPEDNKVTPELAGFAQLAAQALVETDFIRFVEKEAEHGRFSRIFERIQLWLVESLKADETLKPMERVISGRSLAELGDPRKEVITLEHMEFCLVPAGGFNMGCEKEKHLIEYLDYDYWLSRHPVTNAQFDEFVRAGGYAQNLYWQEAESSGLWKAGKYENRITPNDFSKEFFNAPYNFSNHPVVGVSWFEALAFTRWLTDIWRNQGIIDKSQSVQLPSEAEWEKAARGGQIIPDTPKIVFAMDKAWEGDTFILTNPDPDRKFPWGNEIDTNKANYNETSINTTSAVGCFSSGVSPYGCMDMSGNVQEWTKSLWGKDLNNADFKYPYDPNDGREDESASQNTYRVLRGGNFFSNSEHVCCTHRGKDIPDNYRNNTGFRIVVTPAFRSKSQQKISTKTYYQYVIKTEPKVVPVGGMAKISIIIKPFENESDIPIIEIPSFETDLTMFLHLSHGFDCISPNVVSIPLETTTDGNIPQQGTDQLTSFLIRATDPVSTTTGTIEFLTKSGFQKKIPVTLQLAELDQEKIFYDSVPLKSRPVPHPDIIFLVHQFYDHAKSTLIYQYSIRRFGITSEETFNLQSRPVSADWINRIDRQLSMVLTTSQNGNSEEICYLLASLGQELAYHLCPNNMWQKFTEIGSRTMLILSPDNIRLPWELLHDGQNFLGQKLIIGRWPRKLNDQRPYEFPIGQLSIAYFAGVENTEIWQKMLQPPDQDAPQTEILPCGTLPGVDTFHSLHGLHLLRRGLRPDEQPDCLPELRDSKECETSMDTEKDEIELGQTKLYLSSNRPIVSLSFLNSGLSGMTNLEQKWAGSFISAGASAFVGPMWMVTPAVEAAFMRGFYSALWTGQSLGTAFRLGQKLARSAVPDSLDWMAYVLYGDPMARPYRPVKGDGYAVVQPVGRDIEDPVQPGEKIHFRVSLQQSPPVWHSDRLVEVSEELSFENLKANIATFDLPIEPADSVQMHKIGGDYRGWFTIHVPDDTSEGESLVQIELTEEGEPVHMLSFSLNIVVASGSNGGVSES